MDGTWWSTLVVALWVFVLLEGALLLGVLRQLGVLHRRIDALRAAPVGSGRPRGPRPGMLAPNVTLASPSGGRHALRDLVGGPTLVAFVDPDCRGCQVLLPHLRALAARADGAAPSVVVVVSEGDQRANERVAAELGPRARLLLEEDGEASRRFNVPYTPYVYALDGDGAVRGHGGANSAEHLKELLALATPAVGCLAAVAADHGRFDAQSV